MALHAPPASPAARRRLARPTTAAAKALQCAWCVGAVRQQARLLVGACSGVYYREMFSTCSIKSTHTSAGHRAVPPGAHGPPCMGGGKAGAHNGARCSPDRERFRARPISIRYSKHGPETLRGLAAGAPRQLAGWTGFWRACWCYARLLALPAVADCCPTPP